MEDGQVLPIEFSFSSSSHPAGTLKSPRMLLLNTTESSLVGVFFKVKVPLKLLMWGHDSEARGLRYEEETVKTGARHTV